MDYILLAGWIRFCISGCGIGKRSERDAGDVHAGLRVRKKNTREFQSGGGGAGASELRSDWQAWKPAYVTVSGRVTSVGGGVVVAGDAGGEVARVGAGRGRGPGDCTIRPMWWGLSTSQGASISGSLNWLVSWCSWQARETARRNRRGVWEASKATLPAAISSLATRPIGFPVAASNEFGDVECRRREPRVRGNNSPVLD